MQWTQLLSITNFKSSITSFMCMVTFAFAQYALPLSVYHMPPVAVPVILQAMAEPVASPSTTTTSTTTTTTTTPRSVALAVPVPLPVPFAVHAMPADAPPAACHARARTPGCPPCPPCFCLPSCTPAFFAYCSPCHMKCRCTSGAALLLSTNSPPLVFPAPAVPMPQPPPIIMVPFPPSVRFPQKMQKLKFDTSGDVSSDDSRIFLSHDSSESSDSEYLFKKGRGRKKRRRKRIYIRRNAGGPKKREFVRPVLTYVSESGDVKYKTEISKVEAARLMGERQRREKTVPNDKVEDGLKSRMVVVTQEEGNLLRKSNQKKHAILRSGISKRGMENGGKQFVFSPGINKKITNLSVSFQMAD